MQINNRIDQQKDREDASKHTLYDARDNTDIVKRMIKGYNKNGNKIKNQPNQSEVSQSEKEEGNLFTLVQDLRLGKV